ncbi:MAG: acyl carrier protein [Minisyncoccia bacterium]
MTEQKSTLEKVKQIVAEIFKKDINEITEETKFVEDLHASSLDTIALLAGLEGEFKIKIPSEEVLGGKSIKDLVSFIEENLKG